MPQSKRDEDIDSPETYSNSETPTLAWPGMLGKENKLKQKIKYWKQIVVPKL